MKLFCCPFCFSTHTSVAYKESIIGGKKRTTFYVYCGCCKARGSSFNTYLDEEFEDKKRMAAEMWNSVKRTGEIRK